MKKIKVCSKVEFPDVVREVENSGDLWAYISVEGTQGLVNSGLITDNNHYLSPGPNVLNLEFDDIEECTEFGGTYKAYPISEDQARDIFRFGESHKNYNLLIHCYAGKSRSVAIAQGLLDIFPETWELSKESNPLLTPNMKVLRLLHRIGWDKK